MSLAAAGAPVERGSQAITPVLVPLVKNYRVMPRNLVGTLYRCVECTFISTYNIQYMGTGATVLQWCDQFSSGMVL